MKANELMLGDWINLSNGNLSENKQIKLSDIEKVAISAYFAEPIPITEEILKNNGFGYVESDNELSHYYTGDPWFCEDMSLHIGTDRKGHFWLNYYNNSVYGLRYTHELQHAFRLLGIGREIEL